MKKIIYIILSFLYFSGFSSDLDSLKIVLKTDLHDTNKVNVLTKIGEELYLSKPDSAIKYWSKGLSIIDTILQTNTNDTFATISKAALLSNIGIVYYYKGEIDTTLHLWKISA